MSGGGEDLQIIRGKEEVVRVPMMAEGRVVWCENENGSARIETFFHLTPDDVTSLPLPLSPMTSSTSVQKKAL